MLKQMGRYQIERLTEAQRASLRLVFSHHNSKEIAAKMGVSPSAIDKRIERAVQVLGASSRFEAARELHQHEAASATDPLPGPYDQTPSEPIDLLDSPQHVQFDRAVKQRKLVRRFLGLMPGDVIEGTARVRLTRTERLVRLVVLIALIAIASVAIVNMTMTVTALIRTSRANGSRTM